MNNFLTVLKIVSILLIIVLMALMWHSGIFCSDVWGRMGDIGSIGTQIKSTMLVTLWCFIGIEGAVMMSGRARNKKMWAKPVSPVSLPHGCFTCWYRCCASE